TRTTEFLDVLRGVWRGGPFNYQGKFYQVENAGLPEPLSEEDFPEIYFSGSSEAALTSASRHADYYLSWLEPFTQLQDKFNRVNRRPVELVRQLKGPVRVEVTARPTAEEAWADGERSFPRLKREGVERLGQRDARRTGDSVGASREGANRPTTINGYQDLI